MKYIALTSVLALIILSGCSAGDNGSTSTDPLLDESLSEYIDISNLTIDDFEGPYADKFYFFTITDRDPFTTKVLSDSKISEAELAEAKQRFKTCYSEKGYVVHFESDGGLNIDTPPGLTWNDPITKTDEEFCETHFSYSSIDILYRMIISNPDNIPTGQAIVSCLKRHSLVSEDYTEAEWKYEFDNDTGALQSLIETNDGFAKYIECQDDPFDILTTYP